MEKATIIGIDLAKRVFQVHAGLIDRRLRWRVGDEGGRGTVRANRSDRSRPGKAIRVNELKPLAVLICAWSCVSPYRPAACAKPRLVAAIALANKMARSVWAMLSKGEDYRGSALAPA